MKFEQDDGSRGLRPARVRRDAAELDPHPLRPVDVVGVRRVHVAERTVGNNSIETEADGMSVYAHELSHNLGIADNYNNPFSIAAAAGRTGPWDMMSRGTFNGPGGTHTRWMIPPTMGSALGSNHNLRNRVKLDFLPPAQIVRLNRNGLARRAWPWRR